MTAPDDGQCCGVSVLLRPAPLSKLFPYTTLFRSFLEDGLADDAAAALLHHLALLAPTERLALDASRDRKSTRLNSSHLGTSYAVFCLKKKTHENGFINS